MNINNRNIEFAPRVWRAVVDFLDVFKDFVEERDFHQHALVNAAQTRNVVRELLNADQVTAEVVKKIKEDLFPFVVIDAAPGLIAENRRVADLTRSLENLKRVEGNEAFLGGRFWGVRGHSPESVICIVGRDFQQLIEDYLIKHADSLQKVMSALGGLETWCAQSNNSNPNPTPQMLAARVNAMEYRALLCGAIETHLENFHFSQDEGIEVVRRLSRLNVDVSQFNWKNDLIWAGNKLAEDTENLRLKTEKVCYSGQGFLESSLLWGASWVNQYRFKHIQAPGDRLSDFVDTIDLSRRSSIIHVTPEVFSDLIRRYPNLTELNLSGAHHLKGLKSLDPSTILQELHLASTGISGAELNQIVKSYPHLRVLNLLDNPDLNVEPMELFERLFHLRFLSYNGYCRNRESTEISSETHNLIKPVSKTVVVSYEVLEAMESVPGIEDAIEVVHYVVIKDHKLAGASLLRGGGEIAERAPDLVEFAYAHRHIGAALRGSKFLGTVSVAGSLCRFPLNGVSLKRIWSFRNRLEELISHRDADNFRERTFATFKYRMERGGETQVAMRSSERAAKAFADTYKFLEQTPTLQSIQREQLYRLIKDVIVVADRRLAFTFARIVKDGVLIANGLIHPPSFLMGTSVELLSRIGIATIEKSYLHRGVQLLPPL